MFSLQPPRHIPTLPKAESTVFGLMSAPAGCGHAGQLLKNQRAPEHNPGPLVNRSSNSIRGDVIDEMVIDLSVSRRRVVAKLVVEAHANDVVGELAGAQIGEGGAGRGDSSANARREGRVARNADIKIL